MSYLEKVAIGLDQMVNALIGGWPDESLSARAYRWRRDGKTAIPAFLINCLFLWQRDHVWSAYHSEQERRQLPPEYRKGGDA